VAAVVPIEDFNALEDAIDRYFAREADRDVTENPDAPTSSMSAVVAAIFEEETGKGVACSTRSGGGNVRSANCGPFPSRPR
jgi:hypothetical protein